MKKYLFVVIILIAHAHLFGQSRINENHFTEIKRPYKTISPYIASLLKLDGRQLKREVKRFWHTAKQNRLPLIEIDPLDKDYTFLTFIYRESGKNKNVSLDIFGIYDDTSMGNRKLRRLKNTNLFYRSYKVPNDICFSYRFKIKDTRTGNIRNSLDKFNSNRIPLGEAHSYSYSVIDLRENEADLKNLNGKSEKHLDSRIDTMQYTDKLVHKKRNIYVYLPPKYDAKRKKAYPVIYLFDASIYLNRVEVPNILDNLIFEGKIEPMIAVMFGTYRKTRHIILPLNFKFKDEFVNDFLPIIRKNYNVSHIANDNIVGGMSYGGLAASFIALYHPDVLGKVLSQSGSLWRGLKHTDKQGNWLRHDWLIEKYQTMDKKDLRLFFDWGLQENWVVGSNRRMMKVLNQKAYKYKFLEFNGWHDWSNSRKTFSQGLLFLLE